MLMCLDRLILNRGKAGKQQLNQVWRNCYPTIFNEWYLYDLVHIEVTRSLNLPTPRGTADVYYLEVWVYKLLIFTTKWVFHGDHEDMYVRGVMWDPE